MSVPHNIFKANLRAGCRQIGFWQSMGCAYAAEICAGAGFDWLLFDGEHGPTDLRSMLAQLQAVAAYPVHPVGRPPTGADHLIKQYLDIGFTSLLIPMVETAEQAQMIVRAVRYPPRGIRGVAGARAARWGRIRNYFQEADEQICLILQIETPRGLDNLEAIARIEGVDGIFIGASDLSAGLGFLGQPEHPAVQRRIQAAIPIIQSAGKPWGTLTTKEDAVQRCLALDCTILAVGIDTNLLASVTTSLAARFKADALGPATGPDAR